jgi:hypothetical protein
VGDERQLARRRRRRRRRRRKLPCRLSKRTTRLYPPLLGGNGQG